MINKKFTIAIAAIFFIFFSVILVIVFLQRNDNQNFTNKGTPFKMSPVLHNVQSHWINKNRLFFYSGHSIASADLTKNQVNTKTHGTPFLAPVVNNIIWTNYGVFINYSDYVPLDGFYEKLVNHNLPTDSSYWWYFSYKENRWVVLPQLENTEHITQTTPETVLFSLSVDGDMYRQKIMSLDLKKQQQSTVSTYDKNITYLYAHKNKLIITGNTFSNDVRLSKLSLANNHIENIEIGKGVSVTNCNQRADYCSVVLNNSNEQSLEETTEEENISTNLKIVSLADNRVVKSFGDISSDNTPSWNSSFLAFKINGSNNYRVYDSKTATLSNISLKRDFDSIYVITSKKQRYLIGSRGNTIESSKRGVISSSNQKFKGITNTDNIIVDRPNNQILIQLTQADHRKSIENALDDLFIYDIDPNQINIGFSLPNTTKEPLPIN